MNMWNLYYMQFQMKEIIFEFGCYICKNQMRSKEDGYFDMGKRESS